MKISSLKDDFKCYVPDLAVWLKEEDGFRPWEWDLGEILVLSGSRRWLVAEREVGYNVWAAEEVRAKVLPVWNQTSGVSCFPLDFICALVERAGNVGGVEDWELSGFLNCVYKRLELRLEDLGVCVEWHEPDWGYIGEVYCCGDMFVLERSVSSQTSIPVGIEVLMWDYLRKTGALRVSQETYHWFRDMRSVINLLPVLVFSISLEDLGRMKPGLTTRAF
jgi:hypothetical protein